MKNSSVELPISNLILIVCFLIVVVSCIDKQNEQQNKKDRVGLHETAKNHFELGVNLKQKNPRRAIEEFRNAILIDQLYFKAHL